MLDECRNSGVPTFYMLVTVSPLLYLVKNLNPHTFCSIHLFCKAWRRLCSICLGRLDFFLQKGQHGLSTSDNVASRPFFFIVVSLTMEHGVLWGPAAVHHAFSHAESQNLRHLLGFNKCNVLLIFPTCPAWIESNSRSPAGRYKKWHRGAKQWKRYKFPGFGSPWSWDCCMFALCFQSLGYFYVFLGLYGLWY